MAKLALGTKVENSGTTSAGKVSAADINAIQASINAVYDFLFENGIIGIIKASALPDAILSQNQFETLTDQSIGIKTSYLQSLNLGGTPGTPTLGTPTLTATAASTTQINLTWLTVANATSYTLQRATTSNYSDAVNIYTGTELLFNDTGRTADTTYYYRLKATAPGYNDSNYAGTSAKTNAAGATTPAAPTAFVVDDVNNTGNWTNNATYPTISDYEYTLDGGVNVANVTVKPIVVGDVAKAAGQVGVRVKAATGRNVSAWLFNATPYTSTSGGTYIVERRFYVDFSNEYSGAPAAGAFKWNTFKPTSAQLNANNGFTSPTFFTEGNIASTITLTNSGAFAGATGEITTTMTGNPGVYPADIVNRGWSFDGGRNAAIKILGLNPAKFYQLYWLLPAADVGSTRGVTINTVLKSKTSTSILGSFGTAGNGLADPEFIVFNNITGSEITAAIARSAGAYEGYLSVLVIEESNIAK